MMSHGCKVLLYVLISARLMVPLDADDDECTIDLKVRRNTTYKVNHGEQLRIECPVKFCNNLPPTICWTKAEEEDICLNDNNNNHIKTEWKTSNPSEGISYLVFQSIIISDSGRYRCRSGFSVSHTINITVYGIATNVTRKPITNDTNDQSETESSDTFLLYMYSAAGIGSFVIIVIIISVIFMRGCNGKSRKEKQKENQAERAMPNAAQIQFSPRGSPTQGNGKQPEELSSVVYMVCQEGKLPGP